MSKDQIARLWGSPRGIRSAGTIDWVYPHRTVAFKPDSRGVMRVVYVNGTSLEAGPTKVLHTGVLASQARALLAGYGSPRIYDDDHHCGEFFPTFEEGSLEYPHGLGVWVSLGRVWRFHLAEEGSNRWISSLEASSAGP